jgi:glutamate dehydrogenase/leucine dehydrogenase
LINEGEIDFCAVDCDIFAPCATGAVIGPRTIPMLRAKVVCGTANNQLEDPDRDDAALAERGITYVPDFLTNRMGIVNCADEAAGRVPNDPLVERHLGRDWEHSIHRMTLEVLGRAASSGTPPGAIAVALADELSLRPHPIFGHRGYEIIHSLVAEGWAFGG